MSILPSVLGVIGAGQMGGGIATLAATHGLQARVRLPARSPPRAAGQPPTQR